jgi:MarR family transcriptional regulator, organic hydroperoxide resistance regulator
MKKRAAPSLPIDRCVIFLLGKAFQRVSQGARERLAPHGVSPMQYVVLSVLWERDGQSGAELTARLRIDSATITGIIDRLVAAGWVARARDAMDRRVQRVQLTEAGWSLRDELEREMIELNRQIAGQLGNRADAFWTMLAEIGRTDRDGESVADPNNDGRKARATTR